MLPCYAGPWIQSFNKEQAAVAKLRLDVGSCRLVDPTEAGRFCTEQAVVYKRIHTTRPRDQHWLIGGGGAVLAICSLNSTVVMRGNESTWLHDESIK